MYIHIITYRAHMRIHMALNRLIVMSIICLIVEDIYLCIIRFFNLTRVINGHVPRPLRLGTYYSCVYIFLTISQKIDTKMLTLRRVAHLSWTVVLKITYCGYNVVTVLL